MKQIFTFAIVAALMCISCGDDDQGSVTLPTGCSSQGIFATFVLDQALTCIPTNGFTDVEEALGSPDAITTGRGRLEFDGMLSLGVDGSVTLFMGSCIQDLPGPDIRVYQVVSEEAVEVQVSQNEDGPFVSLGEKNCGEPASGFAAKCDFDLAGSGLNNIRIVRVIDREEITFPGAECDNVGPSPGADLDAVEVLHPGT